MLFDDDLPALVLGLSPYWRPPQFAAAFIFRAVTDYLAHPDGIIADEDDPYLPAVTPARQLVSS